LDLRGKKWQDAGKGCIMRSFITVHFTKYYYSNQVKEDNMVSICSTHGRDEKCIQNFSQKT